MQRYVRHIPIVFPRYWYRVVGIMSLTQGVKRRISTAIEFLIPNRRQKACFFLKCADIAHKHSTTLASLMTVWLDYYHYNLSLACTVVCCIDPIIDINVYNCISGNKNGKRWSKCRDIKVTTHFRKIDAIHKTKYHFHPFLAVLTFISTLATGN